MLKVITAYITIDGHPKDASHYAALGKRFVDELAPYLECPPHFYQHQLDGCWLHNYLGWRKLKPTWSTGDNAAKNSLAYHIVQHQKSEWLLLAGCLDPRPDVFVWLDIGILGVPGVTAEVIIDFLKRAKTERGIAIPGCWPKQESINDSNPCWRFCGGTAVVPRDHLYEFDTAVKQEIIEHINATNNVSWEVNTWARMEQKNPQLPLWWYEADHNEKMFTQYQEVKRAN